MWIEKGKVKIFFDQKIKTAHGELYAIYIDPQMKNVTGLFMNEGKDVNTNTIHKQLVHAFEAITRLKVKFLGLRIKGNFDVCTECGTFCLRCRECSKLSGLSNASTIAKLGS